MSRFILIMHRIIQILLVVSTTVGAVQQSHAQTESEKKNSYKSLKSRSSQASIQQLLSDARSTREKNPAQSLSYVQEALGMSLAQGDGLNEARCYLMLGQINERIQEWALARDNYQKAIAKPELKNTSEYNQALQGLGFTNLKMSNFDAALTAYQEALNLTSNENERAARILDISEVYYQMAQFNDALKILDGAGGNTKDEAMTGKIQNQKAKIYARLNELDKANDYYQSSQRNLRPVENAADASRDQPVLQSAKEEISEGYRVQKRYDEDIALRNQSIDYNLESNNLNEVSKDKIELSKSLAAKGETNKAIKELEEAALLADTINNPGEQAKAFLTLADLYEKNDRPQQALQAYKRYAEAAQRSSEANALVLEEKADLIKRQKEIEELTRTVTLARQEEQTLSQRQRIVIYGLVLLLCVLLVTSYFIYRNALASRRANQLLALKSLRGQMNPHFIFNALNSVNQFISENDERTANKYLAEFSRLMRLVLENSQEDFIPLQKEEEIIDLYVKLEHYRFRDKFEYTLTVDADLIRETIQIPPMLIQPYVENAVWHGLRYKEGKGKLDIHFKKEPTNLIVLIEDDGIGRHKSQAMKTDNQKRHQSTGLKNIQERLSILNSVYKTNYQVKVEDIFPQSGTRVSVTIPLINGSV